MPRAVLADPNGLLGWPKVTETARLPGRGVEPRATNLRVLAFLPYLLPERTAKSAPGRAPQKGTERQ